MRFVGTAACAASLLLGSILSASAQTAKTQIGDWAITSKTDPMTDVVKYIAVAKADDQQSALVFTCEKPGKGSTYFGVISKKFLSAKPDAYDMMVRFDSDTPYLTWVLYNKSTAVMHQNTGPLRDSFRKFISRIVSAETVSLRLYDYNTQAVDLNIAVRGANDALGFVARQCQEL